MNVYMYVGEDDKVHTEFPIELKLDKYIQTTVLKTAHIFVQRNATEEMSYILPRSKQALKTERVTMEEKRSICIGQ